MARELNRQKSKHLWWNCTLFNISIFKVNCLEYNNISNELDVEIIRIQVINIGEIGLFRPDLDGVFRLKSNF